jgi:hypothetical protein
MSDKPVDPPPNVYAGTLPYPGMLVHLYIDGSIVLYDEFAQVGVRVKVTNLHQIADDAAKALSTISAGLATALKKSTEGLDDDGGPT